MKRSGEERAVLGICLGLALVILVLYGQVRDHAFVDFDDYEYITENHHVNSGLTAGNIIWAFTSYHSHNWHPLTWISHMTDVQLFGLNPAGHHLVNVLWHIINSILLLLLLRRLTGALGPSAAVAALFALHPLHVESVAWAAERKDVLSTFFWLLTTWMYARYTEKPGGKRYGLIMLFFTLGLLSKQMLVTLPFTLLLLDYWPLGRIGGGGQKQVRISSLILEKLPLFALALMAGLIVFLVQQRSGVLYSLTPFPLQIRLENALVSYVSYIAMMLWPVNLAVFYPHPLHSLALWKIMGAAGLLLALSAGIIWKARRYPYLVTGWFWYLGTLVPVIGLVQVGVQARADRYTYIPLIGLFIIIAWGGQELVACLTGDQIPGTPGGPPAKDGPSPPGPKKKRRGGLPAGPNLAARGAKLPPPSARPRTGSLLPIRTARTLATAVLMILSFLTWKQVGYWHDNITLYDHAARVITGNYWAANNLGAALASRGQIDAALPWFAESLKIMPYYPGANQNMAAALYTQGRYAEALPFLERALKLQPQNPDLHVTLGAVLLKMNRNTAAAAHFQEALKIRPGDHNAATGLREAEP
jgi:protein O-mannosyl-transferase